MMRELQCAECQVPPSPNFKGDENRPLKKRPRGYGDREPEHQWESANERRTLTRGYILVTGPLGQYHLGLLSHEKNSSFLSNSSPSYHFMKINDRVGKAK